MKQDHVEWCRKFFVDLADGGLWHVPRSGLVFQKRGDLLVWVAAVPPEYAYENLDVEKTRFQDFQTNKRHFEKAGVEVRVVDDPPLFSSFGVAEQYFRDNPMANPVPGRRCISCHQIKPEREYPSRAALMCNFCTPVSDNLTNRILGPIPDAVLSPSGGLSPALDMAAALNDPQRYKRSDTPSMRELARRSPAPAPASLSVAMQRAGRPPKSVMDRADDFRNHAGPFDAEVAGAERDDRPLIDKLHEATFTNPPGLSYIDDKYAFRALLRKAHCFTLDDVTSTLVADFSLAIANDLESARRMAIPPFPVTWIDINNPKRLDRMKALGSTLTPSAAGEKDGPPVDRVGWLIQPGRDLPNSYYMTYVTAMDQGIFVAPLSYWWSTIEPNPDDTPLDSFVHQLAMGMVHSNVNPADAYVQACPQQDFDTMRRHLDHTNVQLMMQEIAGELRHVWGLLIALGAGGLQAKITPQARHTDIRRMPNGKPLLPLEHKLLHLHLGKHTPARIVARATTHHQNRWHEVRGHFRTIKNKDGSVKIRIQVKSHSRGDERLGRIEKTYLVER